MRLRGLPNNLADRLTAFGVLTATTRLRYLLKMTMRSQTRLVSALVISLLLLLVGGGSRAQAPAESRPLLVVASIQPWASVIEQLGAERVSVSVLLPAGASPHAFEPTPSQVVSLAAADLVVLNGGLDSWLERLLTATTADVPTVRLLNATEFDPLQAVGHRPGHGDDVGSQDPDLDAIDVVANPHIWLDPTIVAAAIPQLVAALTDVDSVGAELYDRNAAILLGDLERVDREIEALFSGLKGAAFVPFHDAWGYFARRYGLVVAATLEPFAGREPSARYVLETVRVIQDSGVGVIFDERQLSNRTAQVIAETAGVGIVTLDPLGGGRGPERYQDLLLLNAATIAGALRR